MRRARFCLIGPALFALAACASLEPTTPSPTHADGAPAPVAGYDWFYSAADSEARLAYGVKDSDELKLALSCKTGSGRLDLGAPGPRGARDIHLESGGETERFAASGEPSELHDGDFLTGTAEASHPVFLRFRRVGWMAIRQGERRETLVPHPASLGDVERFFAVCG